MRGDFVGKHEYVLKGTMRDWICILTDGTYPPWACFQKGFSQPMTDKQELFPENWQLSVRMLRELLAF